MLAMTYVTIFRFVPCGQGACDMIEDHQTRKRCDAWWCLAGRVARSALYKNSHFAFSSHIASMSMV